MSTIEDDNWCYVSRIAVEDLGWNLDDRRQAPADQTPNLESAKNGDSLTVYPSGVDEQTLQTTWITSDGWTEVEQ